jgi:c-di-GMP-binding flagellar brake protein YcgR
MGEERRNQPRVSIDAFVKVSSEEREYVFRTRDVSTSGFFLYTRVGHIYPFKVGHTLRIELYDYDQFVACKAVVVRVVREETPEAINFPLGFGVRVLEIAPDDRRRLENMIARAENGQPPY